MARDLTGTMLTELAASSKRPVFFYEGVFASGTLRLCSLPYTQSWNSLSWLGAGQLLGISNINESSEIREQLFTVSLAANSAIVQLALAQSRRGQAGSVWVGTLDASNAVNADPYLAFEGRLDVPRVQPGERPMVSITYGSRVRDLERAREERITHEELQRLFPGDLGRQYLAELQDKTIIW